MGTPKPTEDGCSAASIVLRKLMELEKLKFLLPRWDLLKLRMVSSSLTELRAVDVTE